MFSASIGRVGLGQHIVINYRAGSPPPITTSTGTGIFVEDQPGSSFIVPERTAIVKLQVQRTVAADGRLCFS